ncbi:orotidine 5'-phosphate decarboxylase / HUMPS family protein [Roseivivax sediminis]|uniref:Orotidine 5'-phosphate decarboxylase n=1 Tax=Roseivivax sediminis TaxID=936889 RepID=A0A1I1ZYU1_9RHOB|nr:orotidine 5'-phosphate decarboxylase / HUMPS family protein [Roseivivax sediminis]SFE36835.1 orotidine-5'-phosphate decarboxylase [Roseivivax sediminis]
MLTQKLIVSLDVREALTGLTIAERLGEDIEFYRIGLGMLTGGGLALANELKQAHGKRVFLDMTLGGMAEEVAEAVHGLTQFEIDYLSVAADPDVVRAAVRASRGTATSVLATAIAPARLELLTQRDEAGGEAAEVAARCERALAAGADGVVVAADHVSAVRPLGVAVGRLVIAVRTEEEGRPAEAVTQGADHIVIGRTITASAEPAVAMRALAAELG